MRDKADKPEQENLAEEQACQSEESAKAAEAAAADDADEPEGEFDVADYLEQYKALEQALAAAKQASGEAEAKLLRMQADFDNYRRRQRQESEDVVKRAAAGLAESLLPVLDNFERAVAAMQDTPEREGVAMIAKQFLQVLENAGLAEIEALGADFDPNIHQAVMQTEAAEADKGKVLMVLQKGYTFNGKLLRAAMVQVGC